MARTSLALLGTAILVCYCSYAEEDKKQPPRPPASASCQFDSGKVIQSDYSSPRMKGRRIFGGLVPYGQIWRTGANQATTLVTDGDLTVEGKEIPAGRYTLFTIPAAEKWTLIISKKTGESGGSYPEGEDLLRLDMKVSKTQLPIENFTIAYHRSDSVCSLTLSWENTQAAVDLAEKKLCWPTTSPLTYSCPDQ